MSQVIDPRFLHVTPVEIRYADIDMFRHVNNARYFTFTEQARIRYAYDVLSWDGRWDSLLMVLARAIVDFRAPVFLNDHIALHTRCARLGTKSFDFEYLFVRTNSEAEPEVVASAETTLVAFDHQTQASIPIPEDYRSKILAFEPALGSS